MRRIHNSLIGLTILVVAAIVPTYGSAQTSKQDSLWLPFKVFPGEWRGTGEGSPGVGKYERSYQFVLNKKFIEVRNKSTYPPSDKKPVGEIHEDWGYFSYDKLRRAFVLRQFHIEGFVNQYKLESISEDETKIVFVSEAIENIPAGWRGRETYELLGNDRIQETFELAAPGKEFEVYSRATLNRVK